MASATRVACDEEGDGDGGQSDGDKGGGRATATRAMATEGEQQSTSDGSTKAGSGWRESVDKATTRPRRWATTNDDSVRRMMMEATKRARVARAMVTAMRVVGDEEGEGDDEKDGGGDEGGV